MQKQHTEIGFFCMSTNEATTVEMHFEVENRKRFPFRWHVVEELIKLNFLTYYSIREHPHVASHVFRCYFLPLMNQERFFFVNKINGSHKNVINS